MNETEVMNEVLNVQVDKDVVETGLEVVKKNNCKGKTGYILGGVAIAAAAAVVIYEFVIKPKKQKNDTPVPVDATACTEEDDDITVEVVEDSEK